MNDQAQDAIQAAYGELTTMYLDLLTRMDALDTYGRPIPREDAVRLKAVEEAIDALSRVNFWLQADGDPGYDPL